MNQNVSWTIIIIAQYLDEFKFAYDDLLNSIKILPLNNHLKYIIFKYESENDNKSSAYLILKTGPKINELQPFFENKNLDFYDTKTLTNFFQEYVLPISLSDKHILITWGHGAGLGFFSLKVAENKFRNWVDKFDSNLKFPLKQIKTLAFFQANLSLAIPHKPTAINKILDTQHLDFEIAGNDFFIKLISAQQLAEILNKSFGKKKIEVMLCINCYMQMLETGYTLKDQVECFIAPQTTMNISGINYEKLFAMLTYNPCSTNADIAENIFVNIYDKYEGEYAIRNQNAIAGFDIDVVSFSANNLNMYTDILININWLSDFYIKNFKIVFDDYSLETFIKTARWYCESFGEDGDYAIVDLTNFLEKFFFTVFKKLPPHIYTLFDEYKKLQQKTIIKFMPPKKNLAILNPDTLDSMNPQFLSIFFPNKLDFPKLKFLLNTYYSTDSPKLSNFQMNSLWDDFIRIFVVSLKA